MSFDPNRYGPVLGRLVETDRNRPLDAGDPRMEARERLRALSAESAFAHERIASSEMASCCLAAVWLLYDYLDESHTISQGIHNASGSFWHAIMHRREGDYSNAKYWFRRVGEHAVFPALAAAARDAAQTDSESETVHGLTNGGEWDPYRFVDVCEAAVRGRRANEPFLRKVQQLEWELMFDDCYRRAVAANG